MLLLYPYSTVLDEGKRRIYIPLCFYFIDRRICKEICTVLIYIPLCFYFIAEVPDKGGGGDDIYIPLCFYFIRQRKP